MAIPLLGDIYYKQGKILQTDVKITVSSGPEHCHFKLLDVERLALSLLSDPRNEQVVMVFVCCHL